MSMRHSLTTKGKASSSSTADSSVSSSEGAHRCWIEREGVCERGGAGGGERVSE